MIENNNSTIISLIGKPGTGKYTISQELANFDYVICDNQLINNPIFSLLSYDGFARIPDFAWETIGQIRNNVFNFITQEASKSYVLTNVLYEEEEEAHRLYKQVVYMAQKRRSILVPVKLTISEAENIKRIMEPSRSVRWKSRDPQDAYAKHSLINIAHPHLLALEVTALSAKEAAEAILVHVSNLKNKTM